MGFTRYFNLLCLVTTFLSARGVAQNSSFPLQVDLGYSTYEGVASSQNVSHWLGVRFAAPPLKDLRWRAPKDPLSTGNEVIAADRHGLACRSSPTNITDPLQAATQSEDCLFLDLYRPTSSNKINLPVYVYISGGGLNANSDANRNGSLLVSGSGHEVIVIIFNYRVGVYGFLAGEEMRDGKGDFNVGILDQRKALEWVQRHISKFGGDPKKVTIGGASAGAGSVGIHLTAYGGRNDNLFTSVHAEAPSFGSWRTVSESQYQYDALVRAVGCNDTSEFNSTLTCLRNLPDLTISSNNPNLITPNGGGGTPLFMWTTCIDGDLIRTQTYLALAAGNVIRVPTMYGFNTNEGTGFTPRQTDNTTAMHNFLRNNFPKLSDSHLAAVDALYPPTTQVPNAGKYFRAAADAYGDIRYVCSSLYVSATMSHLGIPQTYQYHWDVVNPVDAASGLGVRHVRGSLPSWGLFVDGSPESVISPYILRYLTSFVRTQGDPNLYRLEGAPVWKGFEEDGRRLRFVNDPTRVAMEEGSEVYKLKCGFLNEIGPSIGQ